MGGAVRGAVRCGVGAGLLKGLWGSDSGSDSGLSGRSMMWFSCWRRDRPVPGCWGGWGRRWELPANWGLNRGMKGAAKGDSREAPADCRAGASGQVDAATHQSRGGGGE